MSLKLLFAVIPANDIGQAQAKESPPPSRTGKTFPSSTSSPPSSTTVKETPKVEERTKVGCSNCKIPELEAEKQKKKEEADAKKAQRPLLLQTDGLLHTPIIDPNKDTPQNQNENNYPSTNQNSNAVDNSGNEPNVNSFGEVDNSSVPKSGTNQNNNNEGQTNQFDGGSRDGRTETGDRSSQQPNPNQGSSGRQPSENTSSGAYPQSPQGGQSDSNTNTEGDYGPSSYGGQGQDNSYAGPTGSENEIENNENTGNQGTSGGSDSGTARAQGNNLSGMRSYRF